MKRYRVLAFTFDTRVHSLAMRIDPAWEPHIQEHWRGLQAQLRGELTQQFGARDAQTKIQDFIDLGAEPFSVVSYHNALLRQIRTAFVSGSYYPAMTAAYALAERILNHMVLALRDIYQCFPSYKSVATQKQFSKWDPMMDALDRWNVLLPEASAAVRSMKSLRWTAIHFDEKAAEEARPRALQAIGLLKDFIAKQFGTLSAPWFIQNNVNSFIRKEAESLPFVRVFYLPASVLVGPRHALRADRFPFEAHDPHPYDDREITDEEFIALYEEARASTADAGADMP